MSQKVTPTGATSTAQDLNDFYNGRSMVRGFKSETLDFSKQLLTIGDLKQIDVSVLYPNNTSGSVTLTRDDLEAQADGSWRVTLATNAKTSALVAAGAYVKTVSVRYYSLEPYWNADRNDVTITATGVADW